MDLKIRSVKTCLYVSLCLPSLLSFAGLNETEQNLERAYDQYYQRLIEFPDASSTQKDQWKQTLIQPAREENQRAFDQETADALSALGLRRGDIPGEAQEHPFSPTAESESRSISSPKRAPAAEDAPAMQTAPLDGKDIPREIVFHSKLPHKGAGN